MLSKFAWPFLFVRLMVVGQPRGVCISREAEVKHGLLVTILVVTALFSADCLANMRG